MVPDIEATVASNYLNESTMEEIYVQVRRIILLCPIWGGKSLCSVLQFIGVFVLLLWICR